MHGKVMYSLNEEVLDAFNLEVKGQTRSRLVEALIVQFLVEHTNDGDSSDE